MAANQENDALLQELSRLVGVALGSSDELALNLLRLFRQGYTLRLEFVGNNSANAEVDRDALLQLNLASLKRSLAVSGQVSLEQISGPAAYRLDARDVAFLQSIGIDGTRRAKRSRRQ